MSSIRDLQRQIEELQAKIRRLEQIDSRPKLIIPQPESVTGLALYRFTLNEALTTGTADADILEMDGTDTTIDDDVLDPLGIFDTLTNGDPGLCLKQDGNYYVIQAPCPS